MISVSVSNLEIARQSPAAFGQSLADPFRKTGGRRGMFGDMLSVARRVHTGDIHERDSVKELHRKFLGYEPTTVNQRRQEKIADQMVKYLKSFKKEGFEFYTGVHRINWEITPQVKLTGNTPWVMTKESFYYCYHVVENSFDWLSQLRFPLFQQYLADNILECDEKKLRLGLYFADVNQFNFKNFSTREISMAVDETGEVFVRLYKEYEKRKK